jgi:hypothetical protein
MFSVLFFVDVFCNRGLNKMAWSWKYLGFLVILITTVFTQDYFTHILPAASDWTSHIYKAQK